MGQRCTVCQHDERWRIELLRAGGASFDALSAKFKVSADAIARHWKAHVSDELRASYLRGPAQLAELAEKAAGEGASVLDHFRAIRGVLMAALANMAEAGDARGASIVAAQLVKRAGKDRQGNRRDSDHCPRHGQQHHQQRRYSEIALRSPGAGRVIGCTGTPQRGARGGRVGAACARQRGREKRPRPRPLLIEAVTRV